MTLSKSQYIRALQCHKSLWLYKHKAELRETPDSAQDSLFNTGHQVGDLAKELFSGGVEIAFDSTNFDGMVQQTRKLMEDGVEVIYEATFKEYGIFVMVDILVKNGSAWDMYEVKASTHVKEYHKNDTALQWYVLSKALKLHRAYVVHINNKYVRDKELVVKDLLKCVDVTDEVTQKQELIPTQLKEMEQMLQKDMPDIDIGKQCSDPHRCDFHSHCWGHLPHNSVFELSYAMGKQWRLYYDGILSIDDVPDNFKLGKKAKMQVEHHKSGEIKIDKEKIASFLETINYPINFFDFETFQNAIPRFDGQRPYAQIPFQYSLHILHKDGTLEHKEFLADEHEDPREKLAKQMLTDITPTGSIIAYNQSFEQTQIKNLATFLPHLSQELLQLNERFIDLAYSFQHKHYYHPAFKGKYSIKVVLPTLFPNNDELDYKKVGSIQNGGDAMDTFASLHLLKDKTKRDTIRKDLLAYCHLDTLAMVRIWEKLHNEVK